MLKEIEKAIELKRLPALSFDRVSSHGQKDGFSLDNQSQSATSYAERSGLHIVQSFHVVESSWRTQKRKVFKAMIATAQEYGVKHLIFKSIDRMSRNFHDLALIMDMIEDGYTVHFYESNKKINKQSTHSDKMIIGIEASVAKHHSDKISHDIRDMNTRKAERGIAPGRTRPGYRYENKQYYIDDKYNFQYIFDTFDSGNYSILEYCKHLNDRGIKAPSGGPWTKTSLHKLLINEFYAGNFTFENRTHEDVHPAYFTMDRFSERLVKLSDKSKTKRGGEFLLKGFAKHGYWILTGEIKKGKYVYYTSRTASVTYREQDILKSIDSIIEGIRFNEGFADELKQMTKEILDERTRSSSADLSGINTQISALRNKKIKILDAFADDSASQEDVKLFIQDCNSKISFLEQQKKSLDIDTDKFYLTVVDVIDAIRNFPAIYSMCSYQDKIKLLKEYASHIDAEKPSLVWKRPFSYILNSVRMCPTMHARRDSNP